MDDRDSGPIPGIIGQDTLSDETPIAEANSAPTQNNGKIFDSSDFTGVNAQESIVPADEKKHSKGNPFTKWQTWAIISGGIFVSALIAIAIIIIVMGGKISNAEAIAKYDSNSANINQAISDFDKEFEKTTRSLFDVDEGTAIGNRIYPDSEALKESKGACLGRFGIAGEDLNFLETRKSGADLLASGANIVEANDRISRLSASYKSALLSINSCTDDIFGTILKDFDIELGELTTQPNAKQAGYVDFFQPVKVGYKGSRSLSYLYLTYGIYDKNGVKVGSSDRTISASNLASGDSVELDLYNNGYSHYSVDEDMADKQKSYKPKLIQLYGSYSIE